MTGLGDRRGRNQACPRASTISFASLVGESHGQDGLGHVTPPIFDELLRAVGDDPGFLRCPRPARMSTGPPVGFDGFRAVASCVDRERTIVERLRGAHLIGIFTGDRRFARGTP